MAQGGFLPIKLFLPSNLLHMTKIFTPLGQFDLILNLLLIFFTEKIRR